MPFEDIDFIGTPSAKSPVVPATGLRVSARSVGQKGGGKAHFIRVTLGEVLSKKAALTADSHALALQFGTGGDAGKIRVVAKDGGPFAAQRDKRGRYAFTINAATMDGLFATKFAPFVCDPVSVLPPTVNSGASFIFTAAPEMLEAE